MRWLAAWIGVGLVSAGCAAPGAEPATVVVECEPVDGAFPSRLEILGDAPPHLALDDGATLPLLFGGQGSAMTLFRVGVAGDGAPSCVPLRVVASGAAGERQLDLDAVLPTEPVGAVRATAVLAAILPGDTIDIEVTSGALSMRRHLSVGGARLGIAVHGPEALAPGASAFAEVVFDGRALDDLEVELSAYPDGVLEVPSRATLPAGASGLEVPIVAVAAGTAVVRARVASFESGGWTITVGGGSSGG